MKILVTGAAGFIGSNYVRQQLADAYPQTAGAQVTVLDKLTYAGCVDNLAPDGRFVALHLCAGDICDVDLVNDLMSGQDAVVHFAAGVPCGPVDHRCVRDFVVTNVLGTQTPSRQR